MDRLACVDLPALPLQLLLRRHPDWRGHPVAVVAEDRPQALIEWVNEPAWQIGVLPGQRYAAALSLSRDLRAGVVPPEVVGAAVAACSARLRGHTPFVEPSTEQPGVFWLDASGLGSLYDSLEAWAHGVCADLDSGGFQATVVVGFTRFGTYANARAKRGVRVFADAAVEQKATRAVDLDRLHFPPQVRERLRKLGIRTVGAFIDLPASGLLRRFGPEALQAHRMASDSLFAPLRPEIPQKRPGGRLLIEYGERDVYGLLFRVKRLLDPAVRLMSSRGHGAAALHLHLQLDHADPIDLRVRPATPTLDTPLLLDLVRLKLENLTLRAGVVELRLGVEEVPVDAEQLRLFALRARQDRAAAARALARVRADLGERAVGRFAVRAGHLPEAQYAFEPFDALPEAQPREVEPVLVRRMLHRPAKLPRVRVTREDGWQPPRPEQGPILRTQGPYLVNGGWWLGEVRRLYAFAETERGDLLWLYQDLRSQRWYQQGVVQ